MSDVQPIIQVRGVHKSYGDRPVLHDVDLDVHRGESLVVLGASGGGKSTLLRCMVGLERPDRGSIRIQGRDLFSVSQHDLASLRERIGMAFQGGALFGSMTLAGNIDLPLAEFTRLPPSTRRLIARIKLGMVGLADYLDRYPGELSGGMRKRVALARAMALDPDILFFDEPSAGLDPITAAGLDRLINRLRKIFRVTLVIVTHELASAFAVADRLVLIHQGRLLISGSPAEVRESSDPLVRRFLDRQPEEEDGLDDYRNLMEVENNPEPPTEGQNGR